MPQLAGPTTQVRDSFLEAMPDLRADGWLPGFPVERAAADFGAYVGQVRSETQRWGCPSRRSGTPTGTPTSARCSSATG